MNKPQFIVKAKYPKWIPKKIQGFIINRQLAAATRKQGHMNEAKHKHHWHHNPGEKIEFCNDDFCNVIRLATISISDNQEKCCTSCDLGSPCAAEILNQIKEDEKPSAD